MEILKNKSSGDGTGSRIDSKLKTIDFSMKVVQERVAVVKVGVNARSNIV